MTTTKTSREIARYSRYDQMTWNDNGTWHHARVTEENMATAMLAVGPEGAITVYSAHSAVAHRVPYALAVNYLANLKSGFYAHG